MRVGERAGAIHGYNKDEQVLKIFGYGVYEGDFYPEDAVGMVAEMARSVNLTNPRIRLDNGKVVYGCECWWGPEDEILKRVAEHENVVELDIDEVRSEYVFSEAVAEFLENGGLPEVLQREFEVAESTVWRWADGVAKPLPRVRAQIVAFIENIKGG